MCFQDIFVFTLMMYTYRQVTFDDFGISEWLTARRQTRAHSLQVNFESKKSSSSKKKYAVSNKESKTARQATQLTRIEEASITAEKDVVDNVSTDGDSDVFETDPIMKTDVKIMPSSQTSSHNL